MTGVEIIHLSIPEDLTWDSRVTEHTALYKEISKKRF